MKAEQIDNLKPKPNDSIQEKIKRALPFILLVLLLGTAMIIYTQNNTNHSLDADVARLNASTDELKSENKNLESRNANLTKSLKALKEAQASSDTSKTSNATALTSDSPIASLKITSVQLLTPSHFGNTGANSNTDKIRVVYITMKNLSETAQTYSLQQFKAITDTGEIISPLVYVGSGSGNFWSMSSISHESSTDQFLPFDSTKNIVTLEWGPPGSPSIIIPIITD